MKTLMFLILVAVAIMAAGCGTLTYEGMPTKTEPHAMAVEGYGIDFVSIDGQPVKRPLFSKNRVRLTPGQHEILTRLDWVETDSGSKTSVSVCFWSRYRKIVAFDTREGNKYTIFAQADIPDTRISSSRTSGTPSKCKKDKDDDRVGVSVDLELPNKDDWHPYLGDPVPIEGYWENHPSHSADSAVAIPLPEGKNTQQN